MFQWALKIAADMSANWRVSELYWLVGLLRIKHHVREDHGAGTLSVFQGKRQAAQCGELRRSPRRPPGNESASPVQKPKCLPLRQQFTASCFVRGTKHKSPLTRRRAGYVGETEHVSTGQGYRFFRMIGGAEPKT